MGALSALEWQYINILNETTTICYSWSLKVDFLGESGRSTSDDDTPASRRQRLDSDLIDFDFD